MMNHVLYLYVILHCNMLRVLKNLKMCHLLVRKHFTSFIKSKKMNKHNSLKLNY